MMPVLNDGPRGLYCPLCGGELSRSVSRSYPSPAGQYRLRWCTDCKEGIETQETVAGVDRQTLTITGLKSHQIGTLRSIIRGMGGHQ